jgi:hypothetical protein
MLKDVVFGVGFSMVKLLVRDQDILTLWIEN